MQTVLVLTWWFASNDIESKCLEELPAAKAITTREPALQKDPTCRGRAVNQHLVLLIKMRNYSQFVPCWATDETMTSQSQLLISLGLNRQSLECAEKRHDIITLSWFENETCYKILIFASHVRQPVERK